MKIVADPNIPFVRDAFAEFGQVHLISCREINSDAVRDAELLLVRSVTPVNARLLDSSRVRFVGSATIGTDHVERAYLANRNIVFASAEGSNANSVAEYVVAALLELAHRDKFRLREKILGVVGVGNVGSRVVRCAEALGMRVLQNDPPRERAEVGRALRARRDEALAGGRIGEPSLPEFISLDRVLAEADIITLHVPLTHEGDDATFHLFDAGRFAELSRHPILINTARGAVVDNRALLRAIDGNKVGRTVLDVWENEPNISPELLDVTDLGTPHIAGYSLDGKVNATLMLYRAACKFLGTQPKWDPAPVMPPPPVPRIELSVSSGEDDEEILRRVVKRIYDIAGDDSALRRGVRDPAGGGASFDRLRAEYPVRREFFNTQLQVRGASESLRKKFSALGFRL